MLILNLKKEWFEKIKAGEKTHEYREVKQYWEDRLLFVSPGDLLILRCGYCKAGDPEKELQATIKKISIIADGLRTDLKIDKPVYDIEFELI